MGSNVGPTGPTVVVVNSNANQHGAPPLPMKCPASQDSICMTHHAHKKKKRHILEGFAAAIGLVALAALFRKHIPKSLRFWEPAKLRSYSLPLRPLTAEQQASHNVLRAEMQSGRSWDQIKSNPYFQQETVSNPHLFQDAINAVKRERASDPYQLSTHPQLIKDMCNDTRTFEQHDIQNGIERMLFSGHNSPDFDASIRHPLFDPNRVDNQGKTLYHRLSEKKMDAAAEKLKMHQDFKFGDDSYVLS